MRLIHECIPQELLTHIIVDYASIKLPEAVRIHPSLRRFILTQYKSEKHWKSHYIKHWGIPLYTWKNIPDCNLHRMSWIIKTIYVMEKTCFECKKKCETYTCTNLLWNIIICDSCSQKLPFKTIDRFEAYKFLYLNEKDYNILAKYSREGEPLWIDADKLSWKKYSQKRYQIEKRKNELIERLSNRKVQMDYDAKLCYSYIHGLSQLNIDQVVENVCVNKFLKEYTDYHVKLKKITNKLEMIHGCCGCCDTTCSKLSTKEIEKMYKPKLLHEYKKIFELDRNVYPWE